MDEIPSAALESRISLTGLASQLSSSASGYTLNATDATAVPWYSSRPLTVWALRNVVCARPAKSGCVGSTPLSTIAIGTPGPGAVTWSAPTSCVHQSGPVAAAATPLALSAAIRTTRKRRKESRERTLAP